MKNTKRTHKTAFFMVLTALCLIYTGCSENPLIGPVTDNSEIITSGDNNPGRVTIQVVKGRPHGYYFKVTNNKVDTVVNDFHVQFVDTTVQVTGHGVWPSGWEIDPQTTDRTKGKIGVRTGQNGTPIATGETSRILWIEVRLGTSGNKDFNWQATQNGVVIERGIGTLP